MVPVTQGILRTKVSEMLIGDFIVANFKNGVYTAIGEKANTSLNDFDANDPGTEGVVYLTKTQKGLLIPNMVQIPSSTQTGMALFYYLNTRGMIAGADVTIPEQNHVWHPNHQPYQDHNETTGGGGVGAPGLDPDPTLVWEAIEPERIADAIAAGRIIYYCKTDGSYTTDSSDPDIDATKNAMSPVMYTADLKARIRIPTFVELNEAFTGNMGYTSNPAKKIDNFYNAGSEVNEMVVPRAVSIGANDQFGYYNVSNHNYSTFSDNTTTVAARLVIEFVDNEYSVDFDH